MKGLVGRGQHAPHVHHGLQCPSGTSVVSVASNHRNPKMVWPKNRCMCGREVPSWSKEDRGGLWRRHQ